MAKPFQFSIKWMLAATAVVAAWAGLWVAKPSWQLGVIELVLILFVPAFSAVASQSSTGYAKAFWTGVLVSTVLGALVFFDGMLMLTKSSLMNASSEWSIGDWQHSLTGVARYGPAIVFFGSFAPLVGALCVVGRWLLGKKE